MRVCVFVWARVCVWRNVKWLSGIFTRNSFIFSRATTAENVLFIWASVSDSESEKQAKQKAAEKYTEKEIKLPPAALSHQPKPRPRFARTHAENGGKKNKTKQEKIPATERKQHENVYLI